MMNRIINIFNQELGKNVQKITKLGGMTNQNFLVESESQTYVFRLPGEMTQSLISRKYEKYNSSIASAYKYNVDTVYFDEISGIKITKYLDDSFSFNHENIRDKEYLKLIAKKLSNFHNSHIRLNNKFDVFYEFEKYFSLLRNKESFYNFNPETKEIYTFFKSLEKTFDRDNIVPCHNDLVPENILIKNNDIYFIDWEYSGMNSPLFDLSAFFLESSIGDELEEYFLYYYNTKLKLEQTRRLVKKYQFTQDVLWFLWTIVKEENNENFGDYANKRISRAYETMKVLQGI